MTKLQQNIVVLVGGVGGAKLALGLANLLPPERLTVIINTGDDFWHYGLRICPDIDTVMYTLANLVDPVNGWGVADDTTTTIETLKNYGEDIWFRLGDKDIAMHLLRTHWLREGHSLTTIVRQMSQRLGVKPTLLPMTDEPVATIVETVEHGELDFQEYFVKHRWQPTVTALHYAGVEAARLTDAANSALAQADIILFGPSNPWLSIAPILAVPGMREAITARHVARVAVTPIVHGAAIKGPAAKLMAELGYPVTAKAVADYYGDVINGFVFDVRDSLPEASHDLKTTAFDTIMKTNNDKVNLVQRILSWIEGWELG